MCADDAFLGFPRLFILHHLAAFLEEVTPTEAVEYVLPLLPSLAVDEGWSRERLYDERT
jgi:hypothetical protein